MSDRTASILTNSQRQYVLGENNPSNPRMYRKRIRDRIDAGLFDMTLLLKSYDTKEIQETFEGSGNLVSTYDETSGNSQSSPSAGVFAPGAIAFLIHGLNRKGEGIYPQLSKEGVEQPAITPFREAVEIGVKDYLREQTPYIADVDVSIELDNVEHPDEFLERVEE